MFSFLLMLPAVWVIGYAIYRLSTNAYFRRYELQRYLFQFGLLALGLGAIVLKVMYAAYLAVFGIDLQASEYVELDYVVVVFCMIMVQVYCTICKERRAKELTVERILVLQKRLHQRDGAISWATVYNDGLIQELAMLQLAKDGMEQYYQDEIAQLIERKQKLRASRERLCAEKKRCKAYLLELSEQIEVMIGMDREGVRMVQIAYFYLKEGSSKMKMVNVRLLDGREGTVDIESLSKVGQQWPHVLFRVGRRRLIQHLAVKALFKEGDDCIVEFYGPQRERYTVPTDAYDRLLELREAWKEVLSS